MVKFITILIDVISLKDIPTSVNNILICLTVARKSRMKIRRNLYCRDYPYIARKTASAKPSGSKSSVHDVSKLIRWQRIIPVKRSTLTESVYPRISTASAIYRHIIPGDEPQHMLYFTLYGSPIRLLLPTVKVSTVILNF